LPKFVPSPLRRTLPNPRFRPPALRSLSVELSDEGSTHPELDPQA